jgi:hypothetical protein
MKKLKCVFIIIFLIIAFTTVVSISKCQENELGSVAQGIIDEIETSGNDECMVELKTVTNFEWDRAIIASADFFAMGYSSETLEDIWKIEYDPQSNFRSRILFVKDNKVVYEESYAESAKFNISVSPSLDYYCILPYDDSFAFVTKEKHKSSTCYSLIIYPKNKMN